jgi:transposase
MGFGWDSVHRVMERSVERGLERRELESIQYACLDEMSFRRGHSYVTLLADLTGSRVLNVVEDRTEEAAHQLWEVLSKQQKVQIQAVAVDMWPAFAHYIETNAPQAEIVHDRFHISKHLNEAVDQVRRQEHKVAGRRCVFNLVSAKGAVAVLRPRFTQNGTAASHFGPEV